MSCSFGCHCPERAKPVRERAWRVLARHVHHSAFNGYRATDSDYSLVKCLVCGKLGRTRADYVDELQDAGRENR